MQDNSNNIQAILNNSGKTFSENTHARIIKFKIYELEIVIEGEIIRLVGEGIDIPSTSKSFWKRFNQLLDIP